MTASSLQQPRKPLLTIAIPTYNRSRFLRELLQSLLEGLRGESRIELIISDNFSSDDTPSVVAEFSAKRMQIRSIRNAANIGADANFVQCFEAAQGKYFWLIGDDDLVAPGAVPSILDRCQSADWDMVYLSQFAIKEPVGALDRKEIRNAVEICDASEYARRIHVFFTFISANIINKERVTAANPRAADGLIGTNLAQLGWTFAALDGFRRGLFVHDTLIGARDNIAGGYQLFDVFGPKLKSIVEKRIRCRKVQRAILNGTLRRFLPFFALRYKRLKIPFREEMSLPARLTPAFKGHAQYWICLYPIVVLPFVPAAGWYLPFRCFNWLSSRFMRWLESA